jgi:hypothetical protein
MTEIITGITHQPNFPNEDLSESNADMLELMLANKELLQLSHEAVEQLSWIFRVGHPSIVFSASHIFDEDERLAALNHGVVSFEAITAMVGGNAMDSDLFPTNREASRLLQLKPTRLSNYFDEALEDFRGYTPRTAEVVRASSARFHGALTTYALLGAAMSRKFELSVAA